MPKLREVWTLYRMELRGALRDRMIVTNSLLIPALLYPLVLWLAFLGLTFATGQAERFSSRVAVSDWPAAHAGLKRAIENVPRLKVVQSVTADAAAQEIHRGELDAFVEFLPAQGTAAELADNFAVRITFDASKERSTTAHERLTQAIDRYREAWIEREAGARGLAGATWQVFALANRDVASKKQLGHFILSLMLPVLFTVMVLIGCFYPAIDATAGERERGTWETLMAAPAARSAIVLAKYLYVTTFGFVAGLINFGAMAVTLKPILSPLLARAGGAPEISLRPAAVPIVILGALLLAAFAAAGMMLFASFARTFKEGQSQITPFYMLSFMPMLFLQSPGVQLDARTALIPVANVMLLVRGAILGTLSWSAVGITLAASVTVIALLIVLATFVLRFEDVVVGSYHGSLLALLRARLGRRSAVGRIGGRSHE